MGVSVESKGNQKVGKKKKFTGNERRLEDQMALSVGTFSTQTGTKGQFIRD